MAQREDKLRNLILLGSIFALVGIGLSLYSLVHHIELKTLGSTTFACNISDTLSCDDIANSKYAEDPWGNPVGVYGIGYFLGLLALLVTARVKEHLRKDALQAYGVLVVIGVLVSITFGSISHFIIGKICPTCVGVYLVTLVQLAVLFFSREAIPGPMNVKSVTNGAWYSIIALALVIAGYSVFKPRTSPHLKLDNARTAEEVGLKDEGAPPAQSKAVGPLALLDASPSPSVKIDLSAYSGLGEDFHKGSPDAKVKIVEFADFQCPACSHASKALKQVHAEFGDKILVVFKNFPLDSSCNSSVQTKMHAHACTAARLARCAGTAGKFWPMHDRLFENQSSIDETSLTAWAKELGLSDAQIKECKESKDVLAKIQDDARQASEAGLQGTPTLFINGQKYNGNVDVETMRSIIQALLAG
ncbi:MAG: hypothetical protein EOP10_06880 [Proteobacteria bacterium]|nr:MAG: hypothetical protein EOP10_06880 [Pseudomonadota bacterium]